MHSQSNKKRLIRKTDNTGVVDRLGLGIKEERKAISP